MILDSLPPADRAEVEWWLDRYAATILADHLPRCACCGEPLAPIS